MRRACAALVLSSVALAGTTAPLFAQTANQVWAGCVLNTALANLQADVTAGASLTAPPEIAFVVVYSLNNDNDGQQITTGPPGNFSGPVICRNPAASIATAKQTDPIPVGGSGASSVDILDAEEAFILRYRINGGPNNGKVEKRVCHTVNSNTQCFRISGP